MARTKRKAPWIDRRCCDWDTFLCSLMTAAERQHFSLLLVNWCEARRFWRQYSCTGAEVIRMQRAQEMNDALYNGYGEPPSDPSQGGGGPVSPVKPSPIKPRILA